MSTAARTTWVVHPAALLAAVVLSACAGVQKPPEPAAQPEVAAAEPAQAAPIAAPDRPVQPGSEAGAAAPGPATAPPPRPKPTPEMLARARAAFESGARKQAAGDLRGAAADFEQAEAVGAELPWAAFNAGLIYERLGDDARARATYERAIEAHPDFAPPAQNLVRLRVRLGQLTEAQKDLRDRLARADGVGLRVGLAEALLAAGDSAGAEEECRKALKADEKNVAAMVTLATAYGRRKRFELARMVLENARQVDGSDAAVWNRLGFVEMALGNRPQAIDDFKAAAALRPDYPEAHANYGAILADADDFAGAAQELELAVKYAPRVAGAWLNLGNAYRGLQQFEKAEEAYRKALEIDPKLADVQFNLAVLYLDGEKAGLPTLQRLERAVAFFDAFEKAGGTEPRVAAYRKDAAREVDREKKRLAREEKDRVRKEAEARRKAEEERQASVTTPAAPPAPAAAPPGAGPTAAAGPETLKSEPAASGTRPSDGKATAPAAKAPPAKKPAKAPAPRPGASKGTAPKPADAGATDVKTPGEGSAK